MVKWLKASLKPVGSVITFDGAEMNWSLMPSEADVDELVVVVSLEREEFVANKLSMVSEATVNNWYSAYVYNAMKLR